MKHAVVVLLLVAGVLAAIRLRPATVRPGLDVLVSDSIHLVRGRRVGLVANQAAVARDGRDAVDRLRAAGVNLVALFSPEHGFRGAAPPGAAIAPGVDSGTGLPIYSLYGATRAPTDEMLRGLDVILIDLPDVGARYYTYSSTTLEVMRAAAGAGKTVMVLDRPDPIGGDLVQGNVLDPDFRSFVGSLTVAMRHGMTLGELARFGNRELGIGASLVVIPAGGWSRTDDLEATGLRFIAPSPNLKDPESLYHYPGTCLFEGTALSVGRGTDAPFRQIGAPWLDTTRVLAAVRARNPPGVRFEGITFRPSNPGDGKFADTSVVGIRLVLTDKRTYDPTRTAVLLLAAVQAVHPDRIGFRASSFDRLAGNAALRESILAGRSADEIVTGWGPALAEFLERRRAVLLYE